MGLKRLQRGKNLLCKKYIWSTFLFRVVILLPLVLFFNNNTHYSPDHQNFSLSTPGGPIHDNIFLSTIIFNNPDPLRVFFAREEGPTGGLLGEKALLAV